ncbi:MAG: DUF6138 family protein [Pseudomonadales bacterium]|jgi:hypothetical protein|nr:DUF6138 family protein [Pseudomonadales bacterium]
MHEKIPSFVGALIALLNRSEQAARKGLRKYQNKYKHGVERFCAGKVGAIFVYWSCFAPATEGEGRAFTEIGLMLDTLDNGGGVDQGDEEERRAMDFSFITPEIFASSIAPALETWLREKVCNEKWGGLFDASVYITVRDQGDITVSDARRLQHKVGLVRDFIVEKQYETEDMDAILFSLKSILRVAVTDLYDEFGVATLREFYGVLLNRARELDERENSQVMMVRVTEALIGAVYALAGPKDGKKATEEKFSLACLICMDVMVYGDEYRKNDAREALEAIAERGGRQARDVLKLGSGLIAPEVAQYSDDRVACNANDVTKVIDLRLKEESEAAYRAMLEYLIRLVGAGFPRDYSIQFNSKEKHYIPKIPKTKAQIFWNNCARYPALWPRMKDYVEQVVSSGGYYSDAPVPWGGYATFALGMANVDNFDIIEKFMLHNDIEHSLVPDDFVLAYLEKHGINPRNAEAVVVAIVNMNEPHTMEGYEYKKKIVGLDQPETIAAIDGAMARFELSEYGQRIVRSFLFGKANRREDVR